MQSPKPKALSLGSDSDLVIGVSRIEAIRQFDVIRGLRYQLQCSRPAAGVVTLVSPKVVFSPFCHLMEFWFLPCHCYFLPLSTFFTFVAIVF